MFPNITSKVTGKALSRGGDTVTFAFWKGGWIVGENIGRRQVKRLSQ